MTINQFITVNNVRPADAIVVRKEGLGILDHYVIYLGLDANYQHLFIANYIGGIKFISNDELAAYLKTYVPVKLNHFMGTDEERTYAVHRALTRLNEKAYHFILNNCEHFANWVQKGLPESTQVESFGQSLIVGGATLGVGGLATKNEEMTIAGLLLAAVGFIINDAGTQTVKN